MNFSVQYLSVSSYLNGMQQNHNHTFKPCVYNCRTPPSIVLVSLKRKQLKRDKTIDKILIFV